MCFTKCSSAWIEEDLRTVRPLLSSSLRRPWSGCPLPRFLFTLKKLQTDFLPFSSHMCSWQGKVVQNWKVWKQMCHAIYISWEGNSWVLKYICKGDIGPVLNHDKCKTDLCATLHTKFSPATHWEGNVVLRWAADLNFDFKAQIIIYCTLLKLHPTKVRRAGDW